MFSAIRRSKNPATRNKDVFGNGRSFQRMDAYGIIGKIHIVRFGDA